MDNELYMSLDFVLASIDNCIGAVSLFRFHRKGVDINPSSLKNIEKIEEACFWMMQSANRCLSLKLKSAPWRNW